MEVKLNSDEIEILKSVLNPLVIQKRSGQIGIFHGMDRFVSINVSLRSSQKKVIDSIFRKLGLPGIKEYEG